VTLLIIGALVALVLRKLWTKDGDGEQAESQEDFRLSLQIGGWLLLLGKLGLCPRGAAARWGGLAAGPARAAFAAAAPAASRRRGLSAAWLGEVRPIEGR
jgi:hypothetical protein